MTCLNLYNSDPSIHACLLKSPYCCSGSWHSIKSPSCYCYFLPRYCCVIYFCETKGKCFIHCQIIDANLTCASWILELNSKMWMQMSVVPVLRWIFDQLFKYLHFFDKTNVLRLLRSRWRLAWKTKHNYDFINLQLEHVVNHLGRQPLPKITKIVHCTMGQSPSFPATGPQANKHYQVPYLCPLKTAYWRKKIDEIYTCNVVVTYTNWLSK